MEFYITRRVGTKRNDNFYFLSFSAFSNLFWLEMKPQRYFLIFLIFMLFYWNFLLCVGREPNGTITFIFLLSHPFPSYFGLKWILNDIFSFLQFFWIFYYASGRNEMERKFLFSSFLGLFQSTLAWNEAVIVLFNFLNFFPIFLKFSTTCWVGTKQNGNFYFPSF